jgi:hypothetical protein
MDKSESSVGVGAACRRLDAFADMAGPDMGRWIIEVADRLASRGRCRRSLERTLRLVRRAGAARR